MRVSMLLLSAALLAAACSGDADSDADVGPVTTVGATPTSSVDVIDESTTSAPVAAIDGAVGDFEPADREFRVINLSDGRVDIYGFTTGLVKRYEIELDVGPGEITTYLAPPADGNLVVFAAGTVDIADFRSDGLIGEFSAAAFPERGDDHTIVLSTDGDEFDTFELWENPQSDDVSAGNALPPASADAGTIVMMAVPVSGDSFKPALAGAAECLAPRDESRSNLFVGGTTILPFDLPAGGVEFDLHSFDDGDLRCEGTPAATGVIADAPAGGRTLMILRRVDGGDVEVFTFALR